MLCNNCGHENADGVIFCVNCGNEMHPQAAEVVEPTCAEPVMPKPAKIMGLIAMICGIVSLVMCLCYGSGLVFGIAGLVLGILAKKKAAEVNLKNSQAQLGFTLGLIGLIANILFYVAYIIFYVVAILGSM